LEQGTKSPARQSTFGQDLPFFTEHNSVSPAFTVTSVNHFTRGKEVCFANYLSLKWTLRLCVKLSWNV